MTKKKLAPVYRLDGEKVGQEAACALGDGRLERRMQQMVKTMCKRPAASLPQLFPREADLEAVYRFLGNDRLSLGRILRGHVAHTVARAQSLRTVCVIHDSTEFAFPVRKRPRPGLELFSASRQGFLCHFSLCVSADGSKAPLGYLWTQPFVRLHRLCSEEDKAAWKIRMGSDFTEAGRWLKGIRLSERVLGPSVSAIHLCDREGDAYPLLAKLVQRSSRFVIRLSQNRTLSGVPDTAHLLDHVREQPVLGASRVVQFSERLEGDRTPSDQKTHPARPSRSAELQIRCAQVWVRRPASRKEEPQTVMLNVVDVSEVNAPAGLSAVRWTLCTTESIATEADCWRVVDLYRTRWLVEEFIKAVRTGCAYESRQLDSEQTLLHALGLTIPVAWTLLLLRYLEREAPDSPAETVLPADLVALLKRVWPRGPVPENPSVREALQAIAALGGHRKQNGPPGWLVLHRGYQSLLLMYQGYKVARPDGRCDQS